MDKAVQILMVTVVVITVGAGVLAVFQGETEGFIGNLTEWRVGAGETAECETLKADFRFAEDESERMEIAGEIDQLDGCELGELEDMIDMDEEEE